MPEGYKPSYAGAYGGDFDQKDAGQGSRIYFPVLVKDALVFFGDPHAAISDGIKTLTGTSPTRSSDKVSRVFFQIHGRRKAA